MKYLLSILVLSIGTFTATSTMADPHHEHGYKHTNQWKNDYNKNHDHRWNNQSQRRWTNGNNWRSGHYFPQQYHSSRYAVNYKSYKHLPKPSRYQQWYRVNGDYVLVNQRDHRIIRVIR